MTSDESTSDTLKCPKLTTTNWKPWSALVLCHLESKELLDTIQSKPDGTQTRSSVGTAQLKKDARACTTIMQCAGFDKLIHILHLKTAYDMWETLKTIH